MKHLAGNTFVKCVAGMLCAVMLAASTVCMVVGAAFTMMTREEIVENTMAEAMYEDTQYAYWHRDELPAAPYD